MISSDCTIKRPSQPEGGERLCWEPDCRKPLAKYARKWCGEHGGRFQIWLRNHKWWAARDYVLLKACIREHPKGAAYLKKYGPRNDGYGPHRFWQEPCKLQCALCGSITESPEVDHMIPMNGDERSSEDCRHHVSNLRVLCHRCHAGVTRRQAFGRAADRRGQGVLINV